jgi:Uri superfamily endonuclease
MLVLRQDHCRHYREETEQGVSRGPRKVGVYALLITVPKNRTVRVGRLGPRRFSQGVYVYVGSAMNSLEGRISRHFRSTKRTHWHIDYFLDSSGVRLAGVATRPTVARLECRMSQVIQKRFLSSVDGFGCSDCKCDSHLHYFENLETASKTLSAAGFVSWSNNRPQS